MEFVQLSIVQYMIVVVTIKVHDKTNDEEFIIMES